jgi:DNA replication and repair protein RecF
VLVRGPNAAGKTNLLEALHVVTQGFSPRARVDAQLVRAGAGSARLAAAGGRAGRATAVELRLGGDGPRRAWLNGAALRSAEQLRAEVQTLVFTPDRLSVVKGGPAARRAYLDRTLARLLPARSSLPAEYAAALAQRNAALRRAAAGVSASPALAPWTERVAGLGAALVRARREVIALLEPRFGVCAAELGLAAAALAYRAEPPTVAGLEARLDRDLERGVTTSGPHLDEIEICSSTRDLRTLGSQGEQRLAVLALLLAEAELLAERRGVPPLLLLDDVLSELDGTRRRALASRIVGAGQTVVTATGADVLPLEPAQLLEVSPGVVRRAA